MIFATSHSYLGLIHHEWNMKYYEEYREFYKSVLDEYNTGYRKAKVQAMARQIRELQTSIESIKVDLL